MIQVLTKESKNGNYFIMLLSIVWGLYALIYLLLIKNQLNSIAGYFALVGQVSLDLTAALLSYSLYKITQNKNEKNILLLFFISFVSAFVADSVYHISMNIINVKNFFNVNSFFEVPFSIFLLFQNIAWSYVFFQNFTFIKNKRLLFPYIMLAVVFFTMFIFGISWKISHFSLLGIYQILDTVSEIIGFTLVSACFSRAENITVRLASMGYIFVISSDLLIRYDVISGLIPALHTFETTWVLGLMLMASSFFLVKKNLSY